MDRRPLFHACMAILVCTVLSSGLHAADKPSQNKIKWQADLRAAHKEALKTGKPILLVFGADWCFFCHKLERETLNDRVTAKFINENFVTVKMDLEKDKKVAKILEVTSLPASIVVNSDADLLANIVGYQKPADYAGNLKAALRIHQKLRQVAAEQTVPVKK